MSDASASQAVRVVSTLRPKRLVLSCEHASCRVPPQLASLGLDSEQLALHIGWDIGAAQVTESLARWHGAGAVLSNISRLVIDCNRSLDDWDLVAPASDGIVIPRNQGLTAEERDQRVGQYYDPYHAALEATLVADSPTLLLSVHSFTPAMRGADRPFDIGILFDAFEDLAMHFGQAIAARGMSVRYNEPYSAFDGLIHSAKSQGEKADVAYLEIEVNNALLRKPDSILHVSEVISLALFSILD